MAAEIGSWVTSEISFVRWSCYYGLNPTLNPMFIGLLRNFGECFLWRLELAFGFRVKTFESMLL